MILLSQFPIKTLKSIPNWSDNTSTWYLLQWWFIRQEIAWAYNYLPLWLRVLRNIEKIIREEMNKINWQEILMTSLASKESWEKTWRWDTVSVLFKVPWAWNKEYALSPTHEEVVVPLLWEFINSYKDLPISVYQFQTKFRNEPRAKSWLLRWREFLMKDMYSFHTNDKCFEEYYEKCKIAYKNVFDRLWIWKDTYMTLADGGDFTERYSHEYQTILPIWEDEIHICDSCKIAFNKEIINSESFECIQCKNKNLRKEKACEVWNIFPLETKFSAPFKVQYTDENWKSHTCIMWCYWIWVSRLVWVIAEYFCDDKWLSWPENIAPFSHYIILIWDNFEKAKKIAEQIEIKWWDVIIDDREKFWFWQKIRDAELLWIPNIIVISDKTIEKWWYEFRKRKDNDFEIRNF